MRVSSLRLISIRSFDSFTIDNLNSQLNVIVGPNAAGKTTILESLGVITQLQSFRAQKFDELVSQGQTQGSITVHVEEPSASQITIGFDGPRKQIKVDGNKIASLSKYPFHSSSVCFIPDDLNLIKGSPELRRNYIDSFIEGFRQGHAEIKTRFEKILKHRNRLLKMIAEGQSDRELAVWTEQFIEAAIPFYESRFEGVETIRSLLPEIFEQLFESQETVDLTYEMSLPPQSNLREALGIKLSQLSEAERAVGYTLVGPHRDDVKFTLNGLDARTYGSQGQIRGLVIALKVAQIEKARWNRPLLLLDDIISELDDRRVQALIRYLRITPGSSL